jgi:hypothetical protein
MFKRLLALVVTMCASGLLFSPSCWGGSPLYRADFQATFTGDLGPDPVKVIGSYLFALTPPDRIYNDGTSADYSILSMSVQVGNQHFSSTGGVLRIDNDINLGEGGLRDSYSATGSLDGVYAGNYRLYMAGMEFDLINAAPSALNSLDLPTSAAQLNGFPEGSGQRWVILGITDLSQNYKHVAGIPVEFLSITQIPEPGALSLAGLAIGLAAMRRFYRRTHS